MVQPLPIRGEMQALEFQQCPLPKMRDWTGVRSEGPGIAANRLFLCSQHSSMSDVFMTNFIVLSGKQYNKVCRACRAHDLIM